MIEYFTRPISGIRNTPTFEEIIAYRSQAGMGYRTRPPGVAETAIGHGTLDLPGACARALATKPFKLTFTGPHMIAKALVNRHYRDALARAIAEILAEQAAHIVTDIVQVDEANLPGSPQEWRWAAETLNLVLDAIGGRPAVHLCFGNYGGQRVQPVS